MKPHASHFVCILLATAWARIALAVPADTAPPPEEPKIAEASSEGQQAMAGFRVPAGLKVSLWAAEPHLANPVAFTVDACGRVFVCETFRQSRGVEDNRGHEHWLDDDLAAQKVEDRLAYIQKHLGDKANEYTRYDDRIRLIEDTDGDGQADKATVFAQHFNQIVDGTLAGVLVHGNSVYATGIPHLWLLQDNDGDGQAEERKSLHYGYGVRFAFRGHDMHGLIVGPDGRLYFSIGDRGLNVQQGDRRFAYPEAGAVMRCELDGSNLEMFAKGLRNPQELAFDDHGNLFTGDNNSDSGDRARWVHVVEGGDTGWRMAYQYLPDRGPFNREKIWHPQHEGQPAYIVPPVTNFADGPSGLAYYPGTGLPEHFQGRFFLCDFRGGPANSGVRTFRVKEKGASFELVDAEESIWNVLATDLDFAPDGSLYLTDWVNGWNGEGKGRIYRFAPSDETLAVRAKETQELLADGIRVAGSVSSALPGVPRPASDVVQLLAHADRRVRQAAQFALVDAAALDQLQAVAKASNSRLARLHAIWGVEQLARRGDKHAGAVQSLLPLLGDADAEVRAQAAKVLGDARVRAARQPLEAALADENPRVRYFAAQSLGRLGNAESIGPLLKLLEVNNDQDPVLRHAAVMGLVGSSGGSPQALVEHTRHASPAARMGVLLALRRLVASEAALFLDDAEPRIVVEAARAIHDEPIPAALPQLAALISHTSDDDALLRRVLNANYRLGTAAAADALAKFAARDEAPEAMRLEALAMLRDWARPSGRDRVLGMWRPLAERPASDAKTAIKANLAALFSSPGKVRTQAALVATKLDIVEVAPELRRLLSDKSEPAQARADALLALDALREKDIQSTAHVAVADESPLVRSAARKVLARANPAAAVPLLVEAIASGPTVERQAAIETLGTLNEPAAGSALVALLEQLLAGQVAPEIRLDVLTAVEARREESIKELVARFEGQRAKDDPLASWQECLEGGNAERGRTIFFERTQVSCVRCHKIGSTGGEVGPELTKISADKKRDYLLEAIVVPNKTVAKNFESVVIRDFVGSSRVDLQACKLEYSIVSPK